MSRKSVSSARLYEEDLIELEMWKREHDYKSIADVVANMVCEMKDDQTDPATRIYIDLRNRIEKEIGNELNSEDEDHLFLTSLLVMVKHVLYPAGGPFLKMAELAWINTLTLWNNTKIMQLLRLQEKQHQESIAKERRNERKKGRKITKQPKSKY